MAQARPTLPQVILKARRAQPLFHRHPWVFAGAISRVEGEPEPGDEVAICNNAGRFIGRGLYNPHSNIRVRLYVWDEATPLNADFWSYRIERALELRRKMFPREDETTAFRAIYSEADGLSGLIVDRYGDWLVVQFTSLAMATRRDLLLRLLHEKLRPAGIWLRTEKGIGTSEALDISDGLLAGKEPPRPLFIEQHGLRFGVDVVKGQKTGFYLDQRDNRAAMARYVAGHRVLDLFCYSGAFAVAAAGLGKAKSVLGIDVSASAIELARANAELNGIGERTRFEKADVFEFLEELNRAGEKFDTVILDPPKMIRHRAGLEKAMRGYFSLNLLATELLTTGGLLVTCSCSGLVSVTEFQNMLSTVALRAARPIQILEARGQSPDHPIAVHCPETSYLKCDICHVA